MKKTKAIKSFKFDQSFSIVSESDVKEIMKTKEIYALDLRDGSDFLIDADHDIDKLISSADFAFGTEM